MKLEKFFEKKYRPMKQLVKTSTIRNHLAAIRNFSRFLERPAKLVDLNDESVSQFLLHAQKERAPSWVNGYRSCLVALTNFAIDQGLVETKLKVARIKQPKRIPRGWTVEELTRICDAAAKRDWPHWQALILTLYDTGGRIGAVMLAKRSDFDRESGQLILRAENQKQNADQSLQVSEQTRDIIEQVWCDDERLFPWPYDKGRSGQWQTLRTHYRQIVKNAGLPTTRFDLFHRLRKTTASLVACELGEQEASRQLGHSSMAVTQNYIDPSLLNKPSAVSVLPRPDIGGKAA